MAVRQCTACEELMMEGYVVGGGEEYYCKPACLHTQYTQEQWQDMTDEDGEDENYWTDWYSCEVDDEDITLCFNTLLGGEPSDLKAVQDVIEAHYDDDAIALARGIMAKQFEYIAKEVK